MDQITSFAARDSAVEETRAGIAEAQAAIIESHGSIEKYIEGAKLVPLCSSSRQAAFEAYYKECPDALDRDGEEFLKEIFDRAPTIFTSGTSTEIRFLMALQEVNRN